MDAFNQLFNKVFNRTYWPHLCNSASELKEHQEDMIRSRVAELKQSEMGDIMATLDVHPKYDQMIELVREAQFKPVPPADDLRQIGSLFTTLVDDIARYIAEREYLGADDAINNLKERA